MTRQELNRIKAAMNQERQLTIAFLLILAALLIVLMTGCSGLDRYERTYSVTYQDAEGRNIGGGVTLRPTQGLAK